MSVQTTYAENMAPAVAGQIANSEPNTLISRTVETAEGIGFGLPVAQGAEDDGVIATEAGVTEILGVTVRERSLNANTPNAFGQYDSARIMTKGPIWVEASVAVNAGDPVWVTVATGAWTNADAGGGNSVQLVGARWDSSTSGAGLAKIRMG